MWERWCSKGEQYRVCAFWLWHLSRQSYTNKRNSRSWISFFDFPRLTYRTVTYSSYLWQTQGLVGISKPMYKVCDCQGKNVKVIPKRPNPKVIPLRFLCVRLDLGMYKPGYILTLEFLSWIQWWYNPRLSLLYPRWPIIAVLCW